MIRFIGTSQDSSRTVPLLTSLCQQIYYFLRQPSPLNLPADPVSLVVYFKNLLVLAASHLTIFLLLDSIDQLYLSDKNHYLCWLQLQLPKNCKIIVSVVTEHMLNYNLDNVYNQLLQVRSLGKVQGLSALRWLFLRTFQVYLIYYVLFLTENNIKFFKINYTNTHYTAFRSNGLRHIWLCFDMWPKCFNTTEISDFINKKMLNRVWDIHN